MEAAMRLEVRPIYGWGWTDGRITIETPSPFVIETEGIAGKEVAGAVVSPEHDLAGYAFEASQRHTEADGHYNCSLEPPHSPLPDGKRASLAGYCIIDRGLAASS